MSQNNKLPKYELVSNSLKSIRALVDSSEAHGLLCALFSSGADIRFYAWLNSVLSGKFNEDNLIEKEGIKILYQMFEVTKHQCISGDFDLEILVPCDDEEFYLRIRSLSLWCQGFLSGLGLSELNLNEFKDNAVFEAIEDLSKFSQLQYDSQENYDEEEEESYMQVIEYIKIAVLLLNEEVRNVLKKD